MANSLPHSVKWNIGKYNKMSQKLVKSKEKVVKAIDDCVNAIPTTNSTEFDFDRLYQEIFRLQQILTQLETTTIKLESQLASDESQNEMSYYWE